MNFSGQILRIAFLIIVISLCILLIMATHDFMTGKMPIESYKGLLEILGIPTLIGVIVQSFLHSNIQDKADAVNAKSITIPTKDSNIVTETKTEVKP